MKAAFDDPKIPRPHGAVDQLSRGLLNDAEGVVSGALDGKSGLRVFMTADAVGGVWQYTLDLARGLRSQGVEIALAVLGPAPSVDQQDTATAAGIELILTNLPMDWTAKKQEDVEAAGHRLALMAAQNKPDIIHLNHPALAASAPFPAPVVAVCHSCVATWWLAVRNTPLPEEFIWRTEMVKRGYQAATMLLAPTVAFAEATKRTYRLATTPLVVRNGRHPFQHRGETSQNLFVFTAGRLWDEGKNFAAVDHAAARLALPVLAAGPLEGPNGARVDAHHAIALGQLADVDIAGYLSARPIFVSAARYEPFGLAVLEAAQAQCALILSDISTFRELWDGAAIFVPPDDHEAIADAVERLARDADTRRRLGAAAESRARAYSVEAMCLGVLGVYRNVLASKSEVSSVKEAAA